MIRFQQSTESFDTDDIGIVSDVRPNPLIEHLTSFTVCILVSFCFPASNVEVCLALDKPTTPLPNLIFGLTPYLVSTAE